MSCVAEAELMVNEMVVVCVSVPDVPVIVTVEVPVVAVVLAVNVTTLVDVVGLVPKLAVTPLGRPEADKVTLPVNPPDARISDGAVAAGALFHRQAGRRSRE